MNPDDLLTFNNGDKYLTFKYTCKWKDIEPSVLLELVKIKITEPLIENLNKILSSQGCKLHKKLYLKCTCNAIGIKECIEIMPEEETELGITLCIRLGYVRYGIRGWIGGTDALKKYVSSLKSKIEKLDQENKFLKTQVEYQPDGPGYLETKDHFDFLLKEKR